MSQTAAPARARLMLILPADIGPPEAEALAACGDVAAVILKPQAGLPEIKRLKALGEALQRHDCAVLLHGPADTALRAGLDGAHADDTEALADALRRLKPDRIVGAGGLTTRHTAMEAGESGADYVLFGSLDGSDAARAAPLVGWWSELFEVPCVAVVGDLDAVPELAAAGADFIALAPAVIGEADAAGQVRAAQALIDAAADAAPTGATPA